MGGFRFENFYWRFFIPIKIVSYLKKMEIFSTRSWIRSILKRNQALLRKLFYKFDSNRPVCVLIHLQFIEGIYQLGHVTNFYQTSYLKNNE